MWVCGCVRKGLVSVTSPGQTQRWSNTESQGSVEVEDISPTERSEAGSVVEDDGGSQLYQFKLLAVAPVMPDARAEPA